MRRNHKKMKDLMQRRKSPFSLLTEIWIVLFANSFLLSSLCSLHHWQWTITHCNKNDDHQHFWSMFRASVSIASECLWSLGLNSNFPDLVVLLFIDIQLQHYYSIFFLIPKAISHVSHCQTFAFHFQFLLLRSMCEGVCPRIYTLMMSR